MRFSLLAIAALVTITTAVPNAWPHAKPVPVPVPQLPKGIPKGSSPAATSGGTGGSCQSNQIEKIHEGHGHNINDGTVAGANLGLKLPGGNGCYKGAKSP